MKAKTSKSKAPLPKQALPQVITKQLPEARDRRMLRLLAMVHELHKAGYQKLRICPGIAGTGAWRCYISTASNTLKTNGLRFRENNPLEVGYSGASGNEYFGWRDAKNDTARELAAKFVERFPNVASKGLGQDWAYAGWYVQMLGLAERGDFPIAYAEWYGEVDPKWLPTTKGFYDGQPTRSRLPMPPGGEV